MKTNPPFALWNPEFLALFAYFLLTGVAMLVAYASGARTGEFVFGLVFVGLGAGAIIHALRSRRRWLMSGEGPLPAQHEKATVFARKYKPLALGVGILSVICYAFSGGLIPKTAGDIHRPLSVGMFLCIGIAIHVSWHRTSRWLAQQETETPGPRPPQRPTV